MSLQILVWPDPRLALPSVEVSDEEFGTPDLRIFVEELEATMKAHGGVGLAAPQVGVHKRIITILTIEEGDIIHLINPEIVEVNSLPYKWNEGCLSVPGYFEDRERAQHIQVKYRTVSGDTRTMIAEDLFAFAIQHEIDHLNGKVFVDGASPLKRDRIKTKIKKTLRLRTRK